MKGRGYFGPALWASVAVFGGSLLAASLPQAALAQCTIDAVPSGGAGRMRPKAGSATLYRPKAAVVSPSPKKVFETSNPVVPMVIDFRVIKGFVAKIDIFVNGKKAKTIPIEGERKNGRLKVSFDFSKWGPGLHKVRLEPVNGWPGHQNARGRPFLHSLKVRVN